MSLLPEIWLDLLVSRRQPDNSLSRTKPQSPTSTLIKDTTMGNGAKVDQYRIGASSCKTEV